MKQVIWGVVIANLVVVLGFVNYNIVQVEQTINQSTPAYLELAPVDPRSLIQGDYMRLDYAISRRVDDRDELDERGYFVVRLDENSVVQFVRVYEDGESLADDERLMAYRKRDWRVLVGVDSFFFQEGMASVYEEAEYAEIRLTDGGAVHLIDLVGENFEDLTEADIEASTT